MHRHCLSDGLGTDHADCYEHEHTFNNADGHFHGNLNQRRVFYTDPNTHKDADAHAHPHDDQHSYGHSHGYRTVTTP